MTDVDAARPKAGDVLLSQRVSEVGLSPEASPGSHRDSEMAEPVNT